MPGPSEQWSELPATILRMLERPATKPATSIVVGKVPVTERTARARKYLEAIPGAVSGSGGHDQTYAAAQALTVGFDLTDEEAFALLASEYNPRCQPPWNDRELWHKVKTAAKNSRKPRGYLLEQPRPQRSTPPPAPSTDANDWRSLLRYSHGENPKLLKTAQNVEVLLTHHEQWRGVVAKNTFSDTIVVRGRTPFDRRQHAPPQWRDLDDTFVQSWIERTFDVTIAVEAIARGVTAAADAGAFHPVRTYLDGLAWDGVKRLDEWLTRTFDVEVSPYSTAVGSKWMISAVARIYEPGCKVDCVLVLEGDQGALKSTAAITLCGDPEWFTDELEEPGTKDAAAQLAGRWIVELAELSSLNRAEWNTIKAFAARQVDRYRPAYGHHVVQQQRQCVFVGTVNPGAEGYLRDETGNRRFWPVTCRGTADIEWLRANRDQLWAEAVARYRAREPWHLDEAKLREQAAAEQLARVQRDAWQDRLERWLIGREETSVAEVLEKFLDLPPAKWDSAIQARAGRALILAGWVKHRAPLNTEGKRPWVYRRKVDVAQMMLDLAAKARTGET